MVDAREQGRGLFSAFTLYIATVTAIGLVFTLNTVRHLRAEDARLMGPAFLMAAALLVVGELRPLFTAGGKDQNGVATSTTFVFALLLHWGLGVAILMQAVATVVADRTNRKAWWRTGFNVAQYSLSYGAASWVLHAVGRTGTPADPLHLTGTDLPAIALAGLAFFVCNNLLVSEAISLHTDEPLATVVREDLAFQGLTTAALLALSPVVVVVLERSVGLVPLLLLPLFAVYKNASVSLEREHQALHDTLTGLPNRKLLLSQVTDAIEEAGRLDQQVGLFLLDLDRFKDVNDTLGHHVGDELLTHVADRLASVLRPQDTVARLGGDEFGVLLPTVRDAAVAEEVAERIRAALTQPFHLDEVSLDLEASIGIALYPAHAGDADALMQRADVAMYHAKETRSGIETYDAERDPHSTQRLSLFGQLRRAIEDGELVLHYQPKVDLESGEVAGVEALVRWEHPERGLLGPDTFVPLAEQTGLMKSLTANVLEQALRQTAVWADAGLRVRMAVNVSARDLHDDAFCDRVSAALEQTGVPASMLELELTERVVMADPERAMRNLTALSRLGVRLSLDDFGTGYSSLAYLRRLPVTEIKIDKSFVLRMDVDDEDATIVRSTIDLAHGLGLRVLAEGVETAETWQRLSDLGCDAAQGYFLSRPHPARVVTEWLAARDAIPVMRVLDGGRDGGERRAAR
ncbi:MAG TPA: EAL domain-containing protein [Mycobacteriales bacterium]|jgi:diguanylate cyclase (GGDEF)-like protein|nr:EAL domain-containing protein [Mycobacteriales bacterium]